MFAYRIIHDISFSKFRSFCPKCHTTLAWYDLIPIFSWLILLGKCRTCKQKISYLYPFIEAFTVLALYLLISKFTFPYLIPYFILFSALIVTIRTDLETMLISRFMTLFLIPIGFIFSIFSFLPITLTQSITGSIFGYFLLFFIERTFFLITKKEAMGQGDMELLALIGSFTGLLGVWMSLLIGSVIGSFIGIILIAFKKFNMSNKIPFGPFLSLGSMIYILWQNKILNLLFLY